MSKPLAVNSCGYRIGETHHRARLSDEDVDLILLMRSEWGLSYGAISAKFDDFTPRIAPSTIGDICRGNSRAQIVAGHTPVKRAS